MGDNGRHCLKFLLIIYLAYKYSGIVFMAVAQR